MAAQGFTGVTVAGEELAARPLLARQSVVMGVSDGVIRVAAKPPTTAPLQLSSAIPSLPASFMPAVAMQPLRNDLPSGFDAAIARFEAWCRLLLLDAMQRLGFFRAPGTVVTASALAAAVAPEHARLLSEILSILRAAGWLADAAAAAGPGAVVATAVLADAETATGLRDLAETGRELEARVVPDVASNVRLIRVCMEALPEILAGRVKVPDVMFPGGSPELVEPIYKNPKLSAPFNEQLAGIVRAYTIDRLKVLPPGEKVRIVEVGSGSGGTSAVVMPELLEFGDRVEFVYTDISAQLVGYGRKTYGPRYISACSFSDSFCS